MAFGLKDLVAFNGTALADGAVDGTHPCATCQGPHTFLQRTCEKFIEAFVMSGVWMSGLAHVDVVAFDKTLDDPGGDCAPLGTGHAARQAGHGQLGHQVLRYHRQLIGHSGSLDSD